MEETPSAPKNNCKCGPGGAALHHPMQGTAGGAYGLAFLGAAIYYIQHAATFWAGALGIVKAVLWPAFLVYHLLQFLKM